jgi:hypothetical protein
MWRMRLEEHVERMKEIRNASSILVGNSDEKSVVGRRLRRREININMFYILKE